MTTTSTLRYSGDLTIVKCWCGIPHTVPTELRNHQLRQHADGHQVNVYCPLGHIYVVAGEPEAAQLRKRLERATRGHATA